MDNLNIGVKPINAAGPASPWAYWSFAEGTLVGTTTNKLVNRAWGPGKVEVPDLVFQGTVGTMWTTNPGRCDLQDNGSNTYFRADLDPVVASAFSFDGSGVLMMWAHLNFRNDGTDTGSHSILQMGSGGNSRNGFNFLYHQSLQRIQVDARTGSDVTEQAAVVGGSGGFVAGNDTTVAVLVEFGAMIGYAYINGMASSGGAWGPSSPSMILDASDPYNYISVGCTMLTGNASPTKLADCTIQRLGIMKLDTMPANISSIMFSLAQRRGVPDRWIHAL